MGPDLKDPSKEEKGDYHAHYVEVWGSGSLRQEGTGHAGCQAVQVGDAGCQGGQEIGGASSMLYGAPAVQDDAASAMEEDRGDQDGLDPRVCQP